MTLPFPPSVAWRALPAAGVLVALVAGCAQEAESTASAGKEQRRRPPHLVELATVVREPLQLSRVHTGSLRARRVVRIHTQEEGRITHLPYFEGDAVEAGDVLLELDRTLLETELAKTVAVRKETEANLKRLSRLGSGRMVSEDEVLRARTAVEVAKAEEALLRTRLGYTTVRAPFSGVVSQRLSEPGDIVERHAHVLTVVDPTSLVTELDVSELLLPYLSVGTPVTVRIDALGDQQLDARVLRIHPTLDPATRQGRVEIELSPAPAGARAGQFARVRFQVTALDRQVIPFSALRRDAEGEHVYRLRADGAVERVAVRGGRRLADRVEVLEGLGDGDRVVSKGFLGLSPGKKVKPVGDGAG